MESTLENISFISFILLARRVGLRGQGFLKLHSKLVTGLTL